MRKCRHCKTRIPALKDSNTHQLAGYCDHTCSFAHYKANQDKIRQKAEKAYESAHKRRKADLVGNNLSHQKRLTQAVCNRLARLLDKGKPCISCGRPDDGGVQFCGGHYLTRGAHPEMSFDIRNIMSQCNQYCNLRLSGNIAGNKHTHGYRQGIIMRYGQEYLDFLEGAHPAKRYNCEELRAIRKEYSAEIRRIERGEKPSRDWRCLKQRFEPKEAAA